MKAGYPQYMDAI